MWTTWSSMDSSLSTLFKPWYTLPGRTVGWLLHYHLHQHEREVSCQPINKTKQTTTKSPVAISITCLSAGPLLLCFIDSHLFVKEYNLIYMNNLCVCGCVRMCVCVREREREREFWIVHTLYWKKMLIFFFFSLNQFPCGYGTFNACSRNPENRRASVIVYISVRWVPCLDLPYSLTNTLDVFRLFVLR